MDIVPDLSEERKRLYLCLLMAGNLRHKQLHRILIGIAMVGSAFAPRATFAQSERVRNLMDRYLLAAQKRDYATLAKMTREFKFEESSIRDSNPRSLWNPLLAEFWKQRTDDLEHKQVDDPFGQDEDIHDAREVVALMTPGAKWRVEEARLRPRRPLSQIYYLDVYVAVSYMSVDQAPQIGGRPLRKMILTCVLDGPILEWVRGCSRLEKGDTFWPDSP